MSECIRIRTGPLKGKLRHYMVKRDGLWACVRCGRTRHPKAALQGAGVPCPAP